MTQDRRAYIITASEDVDINDVADDKLGSIVKGASIQDAVSIMATAHAPQEEDVLTSKEFNIITANLTENEAKKLSGETGIKYVELDEEVFAFDDDTATLMDPELEQESNEGYFETHNQFEEEMLVEDLDSGPTMFDAGITDEELSRLAELELQREPDAQDIINFDVDGRLLILDEQLNESATKIAKLGNLSSTAAKQLIASLARELQSDLQADISPMALEQRIERIVQDYSQADEAAIMAIDYITYGLRMIFAPYAWRYTKGLNARVAVVDTGIAKRHSDLRVYGGASFVPGVTSWNDDQGHGTHVAGTIAALANGRGVVGVAPQARLYSVKVLNSQGRGMTSWILNGLTACYRARMHIVNLSLGSTANTHNPNIYSHAYERAGIRLRSRGILAVAAAGNSGRTSKPYVGNPARCPSFMAVAAVDSRRRRAAFSSYGPQVEIAAPGVGVWSTTHNGAYGQKSGTSMAAPHVSGTAALSKSRRPYWSGSHIRNRMRSTASDLGSPGRDPFYGYGLVNAFRSVI